MTKFDVCNPDAENSDCGYTCYIEDDSFVHETIDFNGNDVQAYCMCEHHEDVNASVRNGVIPNPISSFLLVTCDDPFHTHKSLLDARLCAYRQETINA